MSKGYLTTHVLDTYNGKPGSGIKGSLFKIDGENKVKISNFILNKDGRCDEPIFCLLYTSPSPRDMSASRMPSSA